MKQTNNAIKFLLAQYRAIFKHAYLKGLASAVVLTAALAAGANANAKEISVDGSSVQTTDILFNNDNLGGSGTATLSKDVTASGNGNATWNADLTLSVVTNTNSGSLTIKSSGSSATPLNISGTGSLTISKGADGAGAFTLESAAGSAANLSINTVTLNSGTIALTATSGNVSLTSDLTASSGSLTASTTDGAITIAGDQLNLAGATAEFNVTKGNINVNSTNIKVTGGAVTLAGSGSSGSVTFGTSGSTLTLDGGTITLADTAATANTIVQGKLTTSAGAKTGQIIFSGSGGTLNAYTDNADGANITIDVQAGSAAGGTGIINLSGNDEGKRTLTLGAESVLKATSGSITITGKDTTVALNKGAKLSLAAGGSTDTGVKVSGGATLSLQSELLNSTENTEFKGVLQIQKDGTVNLTDEKSVVLNDLALSGGAAASTIVANASGTLAAQSFTLDGTSEVKADTSFTFKSNELIINSGTTTTAAGTFAVAETLNFAQNAVSDSYIELGVEGANTVNSDKNFADLDESAKISKLLAQSGTITGENSIISGSAAGKGLTVANGTWTASTDITVSGSNATLQVGKKAPTGLGSGYLTAAKLVLDGKTLNLDSGNLVVGADGTTNLLSASLDLTRAKLKQNASSISVETNGELFMTGQQVEEYLNDPDESAINGQIKVSGAGYLSINDDLELGVDNFASASASGKLFIDAKGTVAIDGDLTLSKSGDGTTGQAVLDFGSGNLIVNGLTLNNNDVKLSSGVITVNSDISSSASATTLTVANTLNLGNLEKLKGSSTIPEHEVNVKLTVDAANSGALKVNAGNWNVTDEITTTTASGPAYAITVGQDTSTNTTFDANGDALTASLTGTKLTAAANGLTVNKYGTATFTEVEAASSAITLKDGGSLTINGKLSYNKDEPTKIDSYGITLNNKAISVGNNSQLTLGSVASSAITVKKADGDTHKTDYVEVASGTFSDGALNLTSGGVVAFDFDGYTFSADALDSLRQQIFGTNKGELTNGRIDLGGASISGIDPVDGKISWDTLEPVADTLVDIQNDALKTAVVIDVTSTSEIRGNFGALVTDSSVTNNQPVKIADKTTLQNAEANGGKFVTNTNGDLVKVAVAADKSLELINGGAIGEVRLDSGAGLKTTSGDTTVDAINGDQDSYVEVFASNTTVKGDAKASTFITDATSTLTVNGDLTTVATENDADSSFDGALTVKGDATFTNAVDFSNTTTITGTLTLGADSGIFGNTNAGNVVVNKNLEIGENATLTSAKVELNKDGRLSVGEDQYYENGKLQSGSTGYMDIGTLTLNGGTLIIDPDYTQKTSIAAIDEFGQTMPNSDFEAIGGYVDGNIILAQNSALMVGKDASVESMQDFIAQYQEDGHLVEDKVGAVLALNSKIVLQNGKQIIIDPTRSQGEIMGYEDADGTPHAGVLDTAYKAQYSGAGNEIQADLYLGKGSILALNDSIVSEGAAIEFASTDAAILSDGGKIVLAGDKFLDSRTITLFTDQGGEGNEGVKVLGDKDITVETLNGLMFFTMKAGQETTGGDLTFNAAKAGSAFTSASSPVRENLLAYASRTANYDEYYSDTTGKVNREELLAGVANKDIAYYDTENKKIVVTPGAETLGYTAEDFTEIDGVVYELGHNDYLERVTRDSASGIEGDHAARLASFGGAAQAALAAGNTTYNAVSGRMGIGAQNGSITFADNGQGSGLWVTPVYKSQDSDGFDAQGLNYGVDMDLYGLALGADYTLGNGLRVGALFNVGSGDADGQGAGAGVSNDFDYYGFGIYAGYTLDKLSVVADVTYTVVDSDLEVSNMADKLTASTDTSNLSVGVTGQYAFDFNGMSVVPHAGLRYTNIDMDDYTVNGAKFGNIASYSADSMSVFSIPVGVTFAKEFTSGEWTVKPSFDLTLTANMGDDSVEGNVAWAGISNLGCHVESEVVDNFTYGATLGVAAKSGNFSLAFGVNYTGSSNVDEYGVGANARFVF